MQETPCWSEMQKCGRKPIRKCANTVTSGFNNGEYKFKCADGYQQIGGKEFAVCQNGHLNFTDTLRCAPIRSGKVSYYQWNLRLDQCSKMY
ncbi:hypothetical protein B566_EDAN016774 [Ephemera danica]|nr:hypothetical protein B566_EDAN016774 [Ephemera danica]